MTKDDLKRLFPDLYNEIISCDCYRRGFADGIEKGKRVFIDQCIAKGDIKKHVKKSGFIESVIDKFIEECCDRDPCAKCQASLLYESFIVWFNKNGGPVPQLANIASRVTMTRFGRYLIQKFERSKTVGCNVYHGISIKPSAAPAPGVPRGGGSNEDHHDTSLFS